jgi:hypothetical protein
MSKKITPILLRAGIVRLWVNGAFPIYSKNRFKVRNWLYKMATFWFKKQRSFVLACKSFVYKNFIFVQLIIFNVRSKHRDLLFHNKRYYRKISFNQYLFKKAKKWNILHATSKKKLKRKKKWRDNTSPTVNWARHISENFLVRLSQNLKFLKRHFKLKLTKLKLVQLKNCGLAIYNENPLLTVLPLFMLRFKKITNATNKAFLRFNSFRLEHVKANGRLLNTALLKKSVFFYFFCLKLLYNHDYNTDSRRKILVTLNLIRPYILSNVLIYLWQKNKKRFMKFKKGQLKTSALYLMFTISNRWSLLWYKLINRWFNATMKTYKRFLSYLATYTIYVSKISKKIIGYIKRRSAKIKSSFYKKIGIPLPGKWQHKYKILMYPRFLARIYKFNKKRKRKTVHIPAKIALFSQNDRFKAFYRNFVITTTLRRYISGILKFFWGYSKKQTLYLQDINKKPFIVTVPRKITLWYTKYFHAKKLLKGLPVVPLSYHNWRWKTSWRDWSKNLSYMNSITKNYTFDITTDIVKTFDMSKYKDYFVSQTPISEYYLQDKKYKWTVLTFAKDYSNKLFYKWQARLRFIYINMMYKLLRRTIYNMIWITPTLLSLFKYTRVYKNIHNTFLSHLFHKYVNHNNVSGLLYNNGEFMSNNFIRAWSNIKVKYYNVFLIFGWPVKLQYRLFKKYFSYRWWKPQYINLIQTAFIGLKLNMPLLLVEYLSQTLQYHRKHWGIIKGFKKMLRHVFIYGVTLTGLRIKISGKIQGAARTKHIYIKRRKSQFSKITQRSNYALAHAQTRYGSLGIKMSIYYK